MTEANCTPRFKHLDEGQLHEYLDGCLAPNEIVVLKAHLESCPECAMRLGEMQALFSSLESLPDIPLERDISLAVVSALQPKPKLSRRLKWGAIIQAVLALIVLLLALPSLLKTWKPIIHDMQLAFNIRFSEVWINWVADWSAQLAKLQLTWMQLPSVWQSYSILETTEIIIWPIFLTAMLLFIIGNGLILRKVTRNGIH